MNQTSWIAAFIFIGFFVYITVKGELPQYKNAIFGDGTETGPVAVVAAAASAIGSSSTAGETPAVNTLLGQGGG